MSFSNYLELKLLDHVFGGSTFTQPTDIYVSLHSADPGETGASELAATNGYAREVCTFGAAASGAVANDAPVVFTASGGSWSTATHFYTWDAVTTGNALVGGALTASKTLGNGDSATFDVGDLVITLD